MVIIQKNIRSYNIIIAIILNLISARYYALNSLTVIAHPDISHSTIFKPIFNESNSFLFYKGIKNDKDVVGYYKFQPSLGWVHYKLDHSNEILNIVNGPNDIIVALSYIAGLGTVVSTTTDIKSWHTQHVITNNSYNVILNTTKLQGVDNLVVYNRYQDFQTTPKNIIYSSDDVFAWAMHELPTPWTWGSWSFSIENKYAGEVFNKFVSLQCARNSSITKLLASNNLTSWDKVTIPFDNDKAQKAFNKTNVFAVAVKNEQKNYHKLWFTSNLESWTNFSLPYNTELNDIQPIDDNHVLILLSYENYHPNVDIYNARETELVLLNMNNRNIKILQRYDGIISSITYKNNKLFLSGDFINPVDGVRAALVSVELE